MKVTILAIGRQKAGPERDLCERYLDRARAAGRQLGLAFELREFSESQAKNPARRKEEEAAALAAARDAGSFLVALDEGGKALDSRAFAREIAERRDSGLKTLDVAIGGPDGLAPAILDKAGLRLAFGKMTWPHQLVRVMLAEQLYRAVTILSGHPYHRD